MHIVIASGNPLLRETLRSYLQCQGHSTRVTSNGLECIAAVRESRPDSVVLEDQLLWGGCDGVVDVLRNDLKTTEIKAIIVSNSKKSQDTKPVCAPIGASHSTLRLAVLLDQIEA